MNRNKKLKKDTGKTKNRRKNKKLNIKINKAVMEKAVSILILLVLPVILFYTMEWFLRNPFEKMRIQAQLLNIAFFELAAIMLFFLTKSVRIAIRIEAVLALLVGLINYFVVQFRSNPVQPWDIFSIRTAASVADNYEYTLKTHASVCIVVFLVIIVLCHFVPKWEVMKKQVRISGGIICLVLLVLLTNYTQSQDAVKRFKLYDKLFTPNTMTYKDGTVVAFLMQCQYLSVKTPDNYNKKAAEEILLGISQESGGMDTGLSKDELPNIIVIMNEAFSDLSILGEYTTTEDEIPYVRSLMSGAENTISGYMDVSVLGGNTANTEFEFLTGDTMAFLPQGCIPYQQYVHGETTSMASALKRLGYRTLALHPYRATGWERNEVYEHFGFDEFYSQEDFEDPLLFRKYISDKADIDKVIELYEEDADTPLFMFNVTMQNHSSYTDVFDNFTPQIEVEGSDSVALNQYLSLLRESDKELERLINYFDNVDDPTIIVFFGDHQPTDSVVSPIYKLNGGKVSDLSEEELRLRYQVPYLIHANFDIEEAQNVPMSTNYLGIKTLETAGLPLTDYQQFLAEQYREFPSISVLQIMDSTGKIHDINKKDIILNDYQILQYYHLFED